MDGSTKPSRRAMFAGAPFALAAAMASRPATAKQATSKKAAKAKQKPPVGFCVAFVVATYFSPAATPPQITSNWEVRCLDLRTTPPTQYGPAYYGVGASLKKRSVKTMLQGYIATNAFGLAPEQASRVALDLY